MVNKAQKNTQNQLETELALKDLVIHLTSDVRRTLKPDFALEKIFNALSQHLDLEDFFFFRRLNDYSEQAIEEGCAGFIGYEAFFTRTDGELGDSDHGVFQKEQILKPKFITDGLNIEIAESKIRGQERGLLVASKAEPWTEAEQEIMQIFAEQMATVFTQHELHSESLSMAQREFLLNQITTKIRESLVIDNILEIAVQEVAQVIGADACGILITNPKLNVKKNRVSWAVEPKMQSSILDAMDTCQQMGYRPTDLDPSVSLTNLEFQNDDFLNSLSTTQGLKSYLASALYKEGTQEVIGVIALGFYRSRRLWTDGEQQLLESIAKQIETAIFQASIYQESQQTKRQMALLHKLSCDIRDSLDISIVLGQIAKGVGEVLGISRCFVRRFSEDFRIHKTEQEYLADGVTPSADIIWGFEKEWINKLAIAEPEDLFLEYLKISSVESLLNETEPGILPLAKALSLKSYLSIPMLSRGKVLGTINIHQSDRERVFQSEEIDFIFRVGAEAAIAIEHAELFNTIDKMSKTEQDTGLYNKRYFKEIAVKEIAKAKKHNKQMTFMMVDLDHLKAINDTPDIGGHDAGDEAIEITARVLSKSVRQTPLDEVHKRVSDIVGRYGGDEFMILLPDTSIEDARDVVAKRIVSNLNKAKHSTWPNRLTCSIGIATAPADEYDYDSLKKRADEALYLSKKKGRDTVSTTLELFS